MDIEHGAGASPSGAGADATTRRRHPSRKAKGGLLVVLRDDHITGELADQLFDIMERSYDEHRIGSAFRYVYTREEFDEILVLDHGRVIERGTHAALMAHGGRYAELQAAS